MKLGWSVLLLDLLGDHGDRHVGEYKKRAHLSVQRCNLLRCAPLAFLGI